MLRNTVKKGSKKHKISTFRHCLKSVNSVLSLTNVSHWMNGKNPKQTTKLCKNMEQ